MVSFSTLRLTHIHILPLPVKESQMSYPSPEGSSEMAVDAVATGIRVVEPARSGHFAEIETLFAPPLRAVVSAETLQIGWESEIGKNGPVTAVGEPNSESV